MRAHLKKIADEGAREVRANTRPWVLRYGHGEVISGVRIRDGKLEGFFGTRSPVWHLEEFGTSRTAPHAPIRRAAISVLARHGGHYKQERNF
jgi:hypothetical protein